MHILLYRYALCRRALHALPYGSDCLFRLVGTRMRNHAAQSINESFTVARKYPGVPLAARNGDVGHALIEQALGEKIGIHVNEHSICRLPLAGIAGLV